MLKNIELLVYDFNVGYFFAPISEKNRVSVMVCSQKDLDDGCSRSALGNLAGVPQLCGFPKHVVMLQSACSQALCSLACQAFPTCFQSRFVSALSVDCSVSTRKYSDIIFLTIPLDLQAVDNCSIVSLCFCIGRRTFARCQRLWMRCVVVGVLCSLEAYFLHRCRKVIVFGLSE